jgi:carboxymethylenebutenolidase
VGEWLTGGPEGERAYRAVPAIGSGPGVLVLHAWWGLTPMFAGACDRLAAAGFVALAPDLFGGRTAATIPDAERLADGSYPATVQAAALAALDRLRGDPAVADGPLGVVGFSFGAAWALELGARRPDEVAAVVAFYGTWDGPDFAASRAAYLGHFAEHDDFEPLAGVRALEETIRAAGREATFHAYPGARHWFVEPDRPEYDAAAADLAWERTLAFLRERLV